MSDVKDRNADKPHEPVNILIVDDEPRNLLVLEAILVDPSYRLVRATSGEEALAALASHEFALVILDVRLPTLSGFEVAQLVHARRKTAHTPIIFLSAYYAEDSRIVDAYTSGAVDYLPKPVNADILRSKVAVFAELYRRGRALEAEIAQRRKAQEELSELNRSLDERVQARTAELQTSERLLFEAGRRKDEFLATLAHELRNPLAPVRNAAEILKLEPGQSQRAAWATELIARQVQYLSRLIDDLMDVSRITQGRIQLRRERVSINDVLGDAIEIVTPQIEAAGVQFVAQLADEPLMLHADRTRLAQSFSNLLSNAAKYTDRGGSIELTVEHSEQNVRVSVRDTGIGIPPERLESVFEMFAQVDSAVSRSHGGLGIGLSLARRLIAMHGGTISAHSEGVGRGSCFTVELPLDKAEALAPSSNAPASQETDAPAPSRILVADDNTDAADSLSMLLQMLGHQVTVVHDGQAAVDACASMRPDIAILDIGMPKLTGYDACRRILAEQQPTVPVLVALTGWGQEQDVANSHAAGFDMHLVKPVDATVLQQQLTAAAELARSRRR